MTPRTRHVPLRRCAVCRTSRTKEELVRLVRQGEAWVVDEERRMGGRGTWVCLACARGADAKETRRGFARAFRQQADDVVVTLGSSMEGSGPTAREPRQGGMHG